MDEEESNDESASRSPTHSPMDIQLGSNEKFRQSPPEE
jgi:hypothetical protein